MVGAVLYVEALGRTRLAVEERVKKTKEGLEGSGLRVKYVDVGEVIEDEAMDPLRFSALLEAGVEGTLEEVFTAVVAYAPTLVEILSPGRLEIDRSALESLLLGIRDEVLLRMKELGASPVVPDVREVPSPPIGFDEEELWEIIYQGRGILYGVSISMKAPDKKTAGDLVSRLLLVEGCGINSLNVMEAGNGLFNVDIEAVSSFESMVSLVARYLPRRLEIMEPEVIDVTAAELQNSLSDLGAFLNSLLMGEDFEKAYERDTFSFKLA
ncbi:hypothetical protein [Thermococcus profundus]|nr:hypothetical protein [Thermococcus profundus]